MDLRVINFPDKVFKKYLIDTFDKDGDGEISLTEALTITQVLCSQKGIKSVAGIEYLSNLEVLDCSRNMIEDIDISKNRNLKYLSCYKNPLHTIDIKNNPLLTTLYCGNCNITELDCSQNKDLEILSCIFNPLGEIDVWENKKLTLLRVRRCLLEKLELRSLKELEFIDCSENNLYELQLYENKKLTHLDCNFNDLHNDLYVGANLKLKHLDCRKNKYLDSITISEGQHIEEVLSDIKPTTESFRKYQSWRNYQNDSISNNSWEDNIGSVNIIRDSQVNVFHREFADMFKESDSISKRVGDFATVIVMAQPGYENNNNNYFPVPIPDSLPKIRFYQNGSVIMVTQKCGLLKNNQFEDYVAGRIKAENIKKIKKTGYVTVLAELYSEGINPILILGKYRFHPIRVVFKDCLDNAVFQCNGNGSYGVSKL